MDLFRLRKKKNTAGGQSSSDARRLNVCAVNTLRALIDDTNLVVVNSLD